MKPLYSSRWLPVVAGTLAIAFSFVSCDWFKGKGGNALTYEWCTIDYEDSISVGTSKAYQEMHIDFPANQDMNEADRGTVMALRWIREQVMSCSFPSFEGEKLDSAVEFGIDQVERYAEPFVMSCGKQGLDRMHKMLTENEDFAPDFEVNFMNMLQIQLLADTEKYVTLVREYDVYMGGAHGSQLLDGASFSKTTGERLGWSLLKITDRDALVALLKEGLKTYFSASGEKIETDEQLMEILQLYDDPETPEDESAAGVPLPATEPYLSRDGLNFIYQEYEVAAYAYGRPDVTIPMETLQEKGLLSELGMYYVK